LFFSLVVGKFLDAICRTEKKLTCTSFNLKFNLLSEAWAFLEW